MLVAQSMKEEGQLRKRNDDRPSDPLPSSNTHSTRQTKPTFFGWSTLSEKWSTTTTAGIHSLQVPATAAAIVTGAIQAPSAGQPVRTHCTVKKQKQRAAAAKSVL